MTQILCLLSLAWHDAKNSPQSLKFLPDVTILYENLDLVIGSSLGGFITLTLQGMPRILVNPCWLPSVELPRIDASAELVATYAPFEQWAEEHAADDSAQVHAFFADEDELLGDKYISEFLRHYPEHHCHRIHSGHHLSEEGAKVIIDYLTEVV